MNTQSQSIENVSSEKGREAKTWSGLPLKKVYTPEEVKNKDYARDVNNPGEYPLTRGIYHDMYRGRKWTIREICGHSSPRETNKLIKYLLSAGETGINVICDCPNGIRIDSDHPFASGEVGVLGAPLCSKKDVEIMMDGIPLDQISMTCTFAIPAWTGYVALAEDKGYDLANLRGTILNDPLHMHFRMLQHCWPAEFVLAEGVDVIEFCINNMPRWNPVSIEGYDLREDGITASQELGFSFSYALLYLNEVLAKGYDIDQVAPRFAWTMSAHIDIFEEAAKFRAARRLWARLMKERFSAKDPRSWRFRAHVNTAGCLAVRQQPMNNIVRYAYATLGAVLGGIQSLHTTPYLEPISLPTPKSHELAIRTQQILDYEVGAANVADPLGGSYYVEYLTDKIEEEAQKIIQQIEDMGGILEAHKKGWVYAEVEKTAHHIQEEIERGERVIVGQNAFTVPEEEDKEGEFFKVMPEAVEEHLANLRELRRTRDEKKLRQAMKNLHDTAEKRRADRKQNLIPAEMEAIRAEATVGEISGTIAHAFGGRYDPFGGQDYPFD